MPAKLTVEDNDKTIAEIVEMYHSKKLNHKQLEFRKYTFAHRGEIRIAANYSAAIYMIRKTTGSK